jgi:hypothetical protein
MPMKGVTDVEQPMRRPTRHGSCPRLIQKIGPAKLRRLDADHISVTDERAGSVNGRPQIEGWR